MIQDMLDGGRIGDEGNDPHRSATMGANEWKYLEDTGKKGGPEVMGMATGERFGVFFRVLSPLRIGSTIGMCCFLLGVGI